MYRNQIKRKCIISVKSKILRILKRWFRFWVSLVNHMIPRLLVHDVDLVGRNEILSPTAARPLFGAFSAMAVKELLSTIINGEGTERNC